MTFTWSFHPRPYSDDEAADLLGNVVSPQTADWHYNKHHKGYVDALNTIEKGLETASKEGVNGNYSAYGEMKRRQPFNHSGTVLHDVYWRNLGGNGEIEDAPQVQAAIKEHFGSFENWREDFFATAMGTKLSGWAILIHDKLYSGRLLNVIVDEHQNGAFWGATPLVALDMFEHAYYHKDGPARPTYINNFVDSIHWGRVEEQFQKYCQ